MTLCSSLSQVLPLPGSCSVLPCDTDSTLGTPCPQAPPGGVCCTSVPPSYLHTSRPCVHAVLPFPRWPPGLSPQANETVLALELALTTIWAEPQLPL